MDIIYGLPLISENFFFFTQLINQRILKKKHVIHKVDSNEEISLALCLCDHEISVILMKTTTNEEAMKRLVTREMNKNPFIICL